MAARADGLNALDRERAASVADEGGAAGAIAERQESQPPPSLSPIAVALAGAAGVLMAIVAWRLLEGVTRGRGGLGYSVARQSARSRSSLRRLTGWAVAR